MKRFSGRGTHKTFEKRASKTHPLNRVTVRRGGIRL